MPNTNSENTKRIAKNTMMLYVRMLFSLLVSLYTSRVILNTLGVEDYGIQSAVGGFVAMFSLLSTSLSSANSRFLTFELGKGDKESLKQVFSTSLLIHICLALVVFVAIETFGVWFLNNQMDNIPVARLNAANWLLQFSVVSFMLGLISVPYNSCLISHEKMGVFAMVGIVDIVMRLCVVLSLRVLPASADKLIAYAFMLMCWQIALQMFYFYYCSRHFEECRAKPALYKAKLKSITNFAGWNFIGCTAGLLKTSGVDLLLFQFFGPVLTAAKSVSRAVNSAIGAFAGNFMTALVPQITKSYAAGDLKYTFSLVERGSRFSFYVMMFFAIPVMFETEFVLTLWLEEYPSHSVAFVRLVLALSLVEILSNTLINLQNATGRIRNYQLAIGGTLLMNFPLSYIALELGCPPESTIIVAVFVGVCCLLLRLLFLRKMVGLSVSGYLKNVCLNVATVAALTVAPTSIVYTLIPEQGWLQFICVGSASVLASILSILYVGCSSNERQFIIEKMCNLKNKLVP